MGIGVLGRLFWRREVPLLGSCGVRRMVRLLRRVTRVRGVRSHPGVDGACSGVTTSTGHGEDNHRGDHCSDSDNADDEDDGSH